ncbi:tRNA (guanosine(46)-N7)-methyltransferase TrmB [Lysinibacter cavernae]|uniref:tRNA (guanine-N(7)-)-methyltransferase n=1 Tax=Lysinibacter cavernae TaxID=1640652 RepID=A0A7X5QYI4_9MICO|nr:tRNA (guanosine(46)-N7)-methyltransferase TrmB [Lysinibacter cavernae]NIH52338.1 tRNA (guanine-N7-)-methyltransferase [Lysinibacter cavernae]
MSESTVPTTPADQPVVNETTVSSTREYPAEPVSFMRRGTRLQGRRQDAWDAHADSYVVDVPRVVTDTSVHADYVFDAAATFGRDADLVVEIGSGLGEAIVHMAELRPERNYLAVEVYRPGLASTMARIAQRGLTNVRVVEANAAEVLETMLPDDAMSELWLNFPDPWHKKRHNKRRLVRDSFTPLVARTLRSGGLWRLSTDWSGYAEQMREVLDRTPQFENVHSGERVGADSPLTQARQSGVDREVSDEIDTVGGWAPRFEGRVVTSFENKAHVAGRIIFDLTYRRR